LLPYFEWSGAGTEGCTARFLFLLEKFLFLEKMPTIQKISGLCEKFFSSEARSSKTI